MQNRKRHLIGSVLLQLLSCIFSPGVIAEQIEPRAYSNIPLGMNFLLAGYASTDGGVSFDHSTHIENANLTTNNAVIAYARSLDLWGSSGKFDVSLPYTDLDGTADYAGRSIERVVSGLGDARLRVSMNFYGAPALTIKEFARYKQDTIIGVSVDVSIPTGYYESDKLVNIGSNRWSIRPELGMSKSFGSWTTEVVAGARFFSENNDFFGGNTREQDPRYSLQGHLIYRLPEGTWVALTATRIKGGETTLNGVEKDDEQQYTRLGASLALPLGRQHSLKFYASTDISNHSGNEFDLAGVVWQYRWGDGF